MHDVISLAGGDSQSFHGPGSFKDCAPEALEHDSEETLVNLLRITSHTIRGSLLSMLATLKLLNRGYYGKMDEEVAHQVKDLLSSATRLTRIVDTCLGEISAGREEGERARPNRGKEHGKPNTQTSIGTKIEPSIL
jgi:signal transduction histidine kinase